MDKILDVKDLRISFKTNSGLVRAVRGINFDLHRGETLAIVGESGSGKSVTSRAILGISAGNAVVESGEIIFDGQDLLKIQEDDFHKIRGEKISMIFQDPLSSLNPIIKIGRQLTEAMIIKGRINQKKSRIEFNEKLKLLNIFMDHATNAESNPTIKEANKQRCERFDKYEYKHIELENIYNLSKEAIVECVDDIDNFVLEIRKLVAKNFARTCKEIAATARATISEFVVCEDAKRLAALCDELTMSSQQIANDAKLAIKGIKDDVQIAKIVGEHYSKVIEPLLEIKSIVQKADKFLLPEFAAMGYYLTFSQQPLPEMELSQLNKFLMQYLEENFMRDFFSYVKMALQHSFKQANEYKKVVIQEISKAIPYITETKFDKKEISERITVLCEHVKKSIDYLAIHKDSWAYTFQSSLEGEIKRYFDGQKRNDKEQKRFDKVTLKRNALIAKGKEPDWEVVPPALTDLEMIRENILKIFDRLIQSYKNDLANADKFDFDKATTQTIDFLKNAVSSVVRHISPKLAKIKALKIMEEVGIPEPRKRFNQYPFQFSGGMRQRIVIAIALTANPQILICDEPTTALDVTIQAQILELINKLKEKHQLSVIFITHDLGVVANMADRIAVMYAGKIVEYGAVEEVFYSPAHPYTWALLSSMPDLETKEKLDAIAGTPPNMIFPPKGDAFAERNKFAMKIDFEEEPPLFEVTPTHYAATWLLHPNAPKVEIPKIVVERIERSKRLYADKMHKINATTVNSEGGKG